jgi:hypothetical protein
MREIELVKMQQQQREGRKRRPFAKNEGGETTYRKK